MVSRKVYPADEQHATEYYKVQAPDGELLDVCLKPYLGDGVSCKNQHLIDNGVLKTKVECCRFKGHEGLCVATSSIYKKPILFWNESLDKI